jgi:hypothetical protein
MGERSDNFEDVGDFTQEIRGCRREAPLTPESLGCSPQSPATLDPVFTQPKMTYRKAAQGCVNLLRWPTDPELRGVEFGCSLPMGYDSGKLEIKGKVGRCKPLEEALPCEALERLCRGQLDGLRP